MDMAPKLASTSPVNGGKPNQAATRRTQDAADDPGRLRYRRHLHGREAAAGRRKRRHALARLAEAEAEAKAAGLPLPSRGWTLGLLGRAANRLSDAGRAAECFGLVTRLGAGGIDPRHPVILTARYDQAARRAATGDTREAARLLEPVLDRTLLAHGYPALGEAHPLLARARALAERLGITLPGSMAAIDEASLDIDV